MKIFARSISAFNQWRVGATSIDGKEVQVLQGSNPGQPPVNFYFDQSGLLTRIVRYADTAVGRVPTQIDYSDYRDVAGVKIPFKWIVTWTNGQSTAQLTEVQANPNIPATRFAQPAPAPKPGDAAKGEEKKPDMPKPADKPRTRSGHSPVSADSRRHP